MVPGPPVGLRLWGCVERDVIAAEDRARFEVELCGWRIDERDVARVVGGCASTAFTDLPARLVLKRLASYDRLALILEEQDACAPVHGCAPRRVRVSR